MSSAAATLVAELGFWASLVAIAAAYVGYPLGLIVLRRLDVRFGPRRLANSSEPVEPPSVSVLVAAYNEQGVIAQKLLNLLRSSYPGELEIIVASDGSTDETNARVEAVGDPRVRLLALRRGGKTEALNAAARAASGVVLVMTDATTEFAASTLADLVAPFSDPRVGCVGAELVYRADGGAEVARGTGAYWRYERRLKTLEAEICSLIGCSGALYAVRASAHREIDAELDDDFTMPWHVYDQGFYTAYATGAVSSESANEDERADFRMRVRVVIRATNALWKGRRFWNPFRLGWFASQLFAHKVLRYAVPYFLIAAAVFHVFLVVSAGGTTIYDWLLIPHVAVYVAAAIGCISLARGWGLALVHIPFYFLHLNLAALVGTTKFLLGDRAVTWDTERAVG